jgi:hypothetical protein
MKDLGRWLRKAPQPIALLADGQRIEVPKNARAWRELIATVESLEPSKLTALDGQGNVLRSIVLDVEESKSAAASPEMSDLQLFARLLAEGYEKGMRANQPIVDSAMGWVESQGQRLLRADTEIERLRAHIHKQNLTIAELTGAPQLAGGGEDSILSSLLAGAMQAAAGGGGNPIANLASVKPGAKK